MKKLINLFNKKYGHIYGVIDDSIDNEDVFKAYKIIKTLCADDTEIMELLDRVKLPSPKTAKESIDKIDAEHVNGGGFDENDLIKYNIPFDGREVTEIIYDGDMENYEHVEVEEGVYLVKISDEIIDYKYLEGGSMTVVSNDRTAKLILHLDEVTDDKAYTFTDASVIIVVESIEEIPLGVGIWILQENSDDTHIYPSKIEYYNEGNFNLLDEKYIPYIPGKKLENNAEIFNNMFNVATGLDSHAEGNFTSAYGDASHAEGVRTEATSHYSHAEGYETNTTGLNSHAEGDSTIAKGDSSHAEGEKTTSLGHNSHAEGDSSNSSSIIQDLSILTPNDSIITAWNSNKFSLAKGNGSHVEGKNSLALGDNSHAEGNASTASGYASHAEGEHTIASGGGSHAEGYGNTASGDNSHAEGWDTTALGFSSHAEGGGTHATGLKSHAEGDGTTASGEASHTEGRYCQSTALTAHAEGDYCNATGIASHAEGGGTHATGNYSHSEGYSAEASGENSHAEGTNTRAIGLNSHVEGFQTKASSEDQHVQGRYNIEDTENKYAHIVGNGTYDSNKDKELRSNAHTLDWNGNAWYQGKLSQDGVPTEDKDLTTKKYVDDKTKILPVKNNYIIFEDAVPSSTEVASTYNIGEFEYYIFDSLQNEDMIISAVKYNLNVTFNDGTNDRTMDLIIERSLKGGVFCEKDGIVVQVSYSETNHSIEMVLVNANDYTQYSILKATLNCDSYSNLLQDYHIENINYDKIKEVPTALNSIANYENFTLKGKQYYELYDNLSIWDANKFNERLDENSGVKRNEFFKLPGKDNYTMQINQKDSEGIGFGQHISIDNSKNVHIVADAGVDVIIKIYNSTTKELIDTLNYCEAGFYMTRILNKGYLNGVTSIFIAFTVKDSTESFYGNTQVNDLIVHYDSSFLVKEEILTKTNTKEYIPTGDYNPATKKYVDEKIASIDTTINTLPVNGSLNLTTSKFQTTTLATDTEVILPTVEGYTEIHLFFLGISGTNVSDTNVAWNSKPTIEDNKKYEFIYTYVNSEIGWLGKAVVYTV